MSRRTVALGLGLALLAPLAGPWAPAVWPVAGADAFALPAFQQVWARADEPVASGAVKRTWLWGPGPITAGQREPYADAPGGQRTVQYFDKSRMEDNAWRTGEAGRWPVTNGLLVVEMVNGRLQVGDTQFEARPAATVSVAGDPGSGATYADLAGLLNRPSSTPGTSLITSRLLPGGQVVDGQPAPVPVNASTFVEQTQHKVADPFFEFMSSVGSVDGNPYFATGFPITEPYWTEVRLGGQPKQVLMQAFERRALTYTPGNPAGFTVEMGNVGRHYYEWRFGAAPTPPPPSPAPAPTPLRLQPTPLLVPEAMRATLSGEVAARFADRRVNLPAGLTINLFAVLNQTRFAAFSPAGDLYVADPRAGTIVVLPDRDRDGVADRQVIFASGLNRAHSLAFHDGAVYAGETNRIVRLEDRDGDLTSDSQTVIVSDLPEGGQHWTRTVTFGPDGKLYVSVGSSCNVCDESDWHRATILQYNPDGSGGRVYAKGLRNSVGLAWQPGTGRLYATDNGRDYLGDERPPEEINEIRDGADYGWPRCHGTDIRDPRFGQAADACAGQTAPVVEMQAHSAPLGLTFVPMPTFGGMPSGDLIVAFHGSWNRSRPTGAKLVRVPFVNGQPTGDVEDFLTGFAIGDSRWGRPVDVVFGPDGALYVTDDQSGAIYRITAAVSGP